MTTHLIKLLVVSDLHAFATPENSSGSLLDYSASSCPPPNPLRDLIKQAESTKLTADVLVCAGDISNRADSAGLRAAWTDLHELAKVLGNAQLIVTNGNHDLDSRFNSNKNDPDPKTALLDLSPPFPFFDKNLNNQYWARNFAITTSSSKVMLAVLNTSAYHGGKQSEIEHGRVSERTISELCEALGSQEDHKAHVLVCHHHPLPLKGWAGGDDMEFIRNGQDLLGGILKSTSTSWLVIHGHRHVPRLVHGASDNNDIPFVFGAGSLGARITGVANQFHMVTLFSPPENDHASIAGVVETWFWSDSIGWMLNSGSSGLPSECGFGYQGQVKKLAEKVVKECEVQPYITWEELQHVYPGVRYLLPASFIEFENFLNEAGLSVLRDRNGRIMQIGR